ncbi:glycosyltransferase family 39 protein [Bacteroides sp. AN502(2024)]|uniref:glycosyltransferase family 39 protein n=1 Tax=Bacteroides sp. AN502(2024) TaxID=3160599 RepID=UPI003516B2BA
MIYSERDTIAPNIMAFTAIVAAVASLLSFVLLQNDDFGYGFFTMFICTLLLAFCSRKHSIISQPLAIAFIFRIGFCLLLSVKGDGDADNYGVYAVHFANMPITEIFSNIPTGAYFYSWLISFSFRLFGENYMPIRVINATLSVCCVWIIADIASYLYKNPKTVIKIAWIVAVFPNLIRFSSYFANREVILMLFMLLYIKYSYLYYNRTNNGYLLVSILALIPSMILHTSMIAMILLTILIILSKEGKTQNKGTNFIREAFLTIATIAVFLYMLSSGIGMEKFNIGGGVDLNVSSISNIGNMSAVGRAAYLSGVTFSNPVLTLLFLPVRVLYFLYTPFPWMIRSVIDIVGFFDAILYIWASIPIYKKLKEIHRKRKGKSPDERFLLLLFITLVIIIAMFAAVTSNYGTAIRHRCKLIPIFLLIAADYIRLPFNR